MHFILMYPQIIWNNNNKFTLISNIFSNIIYLNFIHTYYFNAV